jgi:hypothetical protein
MTTKRVTYFRFATTRRMLATRDSDSIGFTLNSSQPAAMAVSRRGQMQKLPSVGKFHRDLPSHALLFDHLVGAGE